MKMEVKLIQKIIKDCAFCGKPLKDHRPTLCKECYLIQEIREQIFKNGKTKNSLECIAQQEATFLGSLPPEPTNAIPGSDEKIRVMEERRRKGYSLHHPYDLKYQPPNKEMLGDRVCRVLFGRNGIED
jgi:hypothetical protein